MGLFHFGIGLAVNSCIVPMDLASRANFISNTIHKCLMKNYFMCTEIAKICELSGVHPLDPDQGFALHPLEGPYSAPKPQLLNCNDRTEPGNFREVIISSGMWEI